MCVGFHEGQRKMLDCLEPLLQLVDVGAETKLGTQPLSHLPSRNPVQMSCRGHGLVQSTVLCQHAFYQELSLYPQSFPLLGELQTWLLKVSLHPTRGRVLSVCLYSHNVLLPFPSCATLFLLSVSTPEWRVLGGTWLTSNPSLTSTELDKQALRTLQASETLERVGGLFKLSCCPDMY